MKKQKLILAFSGGLDTRFCVLYLSKKGYDVITATINTGGFSPSECREIEKTALEYGAKKHILVNVEEAIYEKIITYVISFNAKYQGDYPLMCADRYIISEELVKIAKQENASAIAHGSTSNGNDQVRFDASITALDNTLEIITPIKELNLTRDEEIAYIQEKGYEVREESKRYSINQNVFGTTFSGSEIDEGKEPKEDCYVLTSLQEKRKKHITIGFEKGVPTTLNGKKDSGLKILQTLDSIAGKYGYGREIYNGDCIIGVKGRILFECPGLLLLIEAHRKLEQYTQTKAQILFSKQASELWTDLVYSGLYYEPVRKNLEAFITDAQKNVSGEVRILLSPYSAQVVEVHTSHSLTNDEICTYAQKGTWGEKEANGFIKLYGMQQNIAHNREAKASEKSL